MGTENRKERSGGNTKNSKNGKKNSRSEVEQIQRDDAGRILRNAHGILQGGGRLDEELNRRALYLRVRGRLWIVPLAALLGALLGGLVYFLATTVWADAREYQEVSKLYLDFAYDETGTVYDYYNGATWTDLLTANPEISDRIMERLPEDVGLDVVKASAEAEILSDIRLLTVTVTNPDRETTQAIAQAINEALVAFGESAKEFSQITFLSSEGPSLVMVSDRTRNAVLLGLALGLLAGAFGLWLRETLDDAVYVPEDAARRYGVPVLGVLVRDLARNKETGAAETDRIGTLLTAEAVQEREKGWRRLAKPGTQAAQFPWTREVMEANLAYLFGEQTSAHQTAGKQTAERQSSGQESAGVDGAGGETGVDRSLALLSLHGEQEAAQAARALAGEAGVEPQRQPLQTAAGKEDAQRASGAAEMPRLIPMDAPRDAAAFGACRETDGVILALRCGAPDGARVDWLLGQLRTQGIPLRGLVLTGASGKFLREYYR
ncbi:MAG: hypothetical protein Q4C60_02110 [Eubacteriales bacterium]|nr:hypothetical protein [Eubacteriales bacterium]